MWSVHNGGRDDDQFVIGRQSWANELNGPCVKTYQNDLAVIETHYRYFAVSFVIKRIRHLVCQTDIHQSYSSAVKLI